MLLDDQAEVSILCNTSVIYIIHNLYNNLLYLTTTVRDIVQALTQSTTYKLAMSSTLYYDIVGSLDFHFHVG